MNLFTIKISADKLYPGISIPERELRSSTNFVNFIINYIDKRTGCKLVSYLDASPPPGGKFSIFSEDSCSMTDTRSITSLLSVASSTISVEWKNNLQ